MLDAGFWMFDVRCSMFDVGCWMPDAGCWMFDVGCWMLSVRCWMFGVRCSPSFVTTGKELSALLRNHEADPHLHRAMFKHTNRSSLRRYRFLCESTGAAQQA